VAAKTQVSLEDYLGTSFQPDCDYLDGELVERNVGQRRHSKVQRTLLSLFHRPTATVPLYAFPELRLKLATRRYRVADLVAFAGQEPAEEIPSSPPLVAIEILSPDDRFREIHEKLADYRAWGVPHVWFVDPYERKIYVYGDRGLTEVPALEIPEHGLQIPAAKVFT